MFNNKYSIIITSINEPTKAVVKISHDAKKLNADFIVVGDTKSPKDFNLDNCKFLSVDEQIALDFTYAKIVPFKHYARKNIGYLYAINNGSNVIIETDDDNIPNPEFYLPRTPNLNADVVDEKGWANLYKYFTSQNIWPRGLPLDQINTPLPQTKIANDIYCPIQQGLADENPDVDAIYRLILPLPLSFEKRESPIAVLNKWCPFNSQNTTWFPEAFPLLYLPYYCSFRMTDIWRSFVAQRIAYLNKWHIAFHNSTVYQERNEHDLMKDFSDEIEGYLNNDKIKITLDSLPLQPGVENIPNAMLQCYESLISLQLVGKEEIVLLNAWLKDIEKLKSNN